MRYVAGFALVAISMTVFAADEPQVVIAAVSWPATPVSVRGLPAAERDAVSGVDFPVLLPNVHRGRSTLSAAANNYTYTAHEDGLTVTIDGTRIEYRPARPMPDVPTARTVRGTSAIASRSLEGVYVTWREFGAAYAISVECSNDDDARCKGTAFAESLANSLVFVGGSRTNAAERLVSSGDIASSPADASTAFSYRPAGELVPCSGVGTANHQNLVPAFRFPIENAPSFANSQVYSRGGLYACCDTSCRCKECGGQCDAANYDYPWRDNFCEKRSANNPLCPGSTGHQGQDIRPATCKKNLHSAVAVAAGKITSIGSYSVVLRDDSTGVRYWYLHMDKLAVTEGMSVTAGTVLGKVSNRFKPKTPTTIHLHFETRLNVQKLGIVPVPPYTALVASYQRLLQP